MGDYALGWSSLYKLLKMHSPTTYLMLFIADSHKLIKIYVFLRSWAPAYTFGQITLEAKNAKYENNNN